MRLVGLTGGIACGKSTVVNELLKHDITVIDCDKISRDIFVIGRPAYNSVVKAFGESILHDDKTINRELLGQTVFASDSKRKKLTGITGPAIMKEIMKRIVYHWLIGTSIVVIDAPTLYETKMLVPLCAMVIVIAADEATQIERMKVRNNYDEEECNNRINAQMPIAEKVSRANRTIWNNGSSLEEIQAKANDLALDLKDKYKGLSLAWSGIGIGSMLLLAGIMYKMSKL